MNLLETIKTRRSIRKFKSDPVEDENVEQILEAGIWAPSSRGTQPYKFLILKDRKQIDMIYERVLEKELQRAKSYPGVDRTEEELRDKITSYYQSLQQAPVQILLFYDIQLAADRFTEGDVDRFVDATPLYMSQRDSLIFTAQNMMLMATTLGLGTLYLEALRRHNEIINDIVKQRESLEFFICLLIGYPDEQPEAKERNVKDFLI